MRADAKATSKWHFVDDFIRTDVPLGHAIGAGLTGKNSAELADGEPLLPVLVGRFEDIRSKSYSEATKTSGGLRRKIPRHFRHLA